jgi:hypothetical protein
MICMGCRANLAPHLQRRACLARSAGAFPKWKAYLSDHDGHDAHKQSKAILDIVVHVYCELAFHKSMPRIMILLSDIRPRTL